MRKMLLGWELMSMNAIATRENLLICWHRLNSFLSNVTSAWYIQNVWFWPVVVRPNSTSWNTSVVNLSNESQTTTPTTEELPQTGSPVSEPDGSMQEYYQLQQELLLTTLALSGIIFISVWIFYSLNIALNYLIGACTCVVYLRMLAKDVERLGAEKQRLSKTRFALFIGLIIIATQVNKLQILPVFLGFLTYKASLIVYMLRTLFPPDAR